MWPRSLLGIVLLVLAVPLPAQQNRLQVGVLVGATSDYAASSSGALVPAVEGRHLSIGVPVRVRLTRFGAWSAAFLGAVEWSYAGAGAPMAGLAQVAIGPELQRRLTARADVRLAALAGLITRRNDQDDSGDHPQFGFDAASGIALGAWRIGYGYRRAWVTDVRNVIRGCAGGVRTACRMYLEYGPAQTLAYDRHAITLERQV